MALAELLELHVPARPRNLDCMYGRGRVWDPIHVADVGRTSQFYGRYVARQNPVKGDNVTHVYPCSLEVAEWLVRPRTGVCLVKLAT